MTTATPPCRREDTALCHADTTTVKPPAPAGGECMIISEKQFLRDHTMYSAISSWLFAIAGATNIGVLCAFSTKLLSAAEKGDPIFKGTSGKPAVLGNKKYNRIALGMMAFGGACMAVSNFLESKKVVTEWQLGAGKMQRKANIVEKELNKKEEADNAMVAPAAVDKLLASRAEQKEAAVSAAR